MNRERAGSTEQHLLRAGGLALAKASKESSVLAARRQRCTPPPHACFFWCCGLAGASDLFCFYAPADPTGPDPYLLRASTQVRWWTSAAARTPPTACRWATGSAWDGSSPPASAARTASGARSTSARRAPPLSSPSAAWGDSRTTCGFPPPPATRSRKGSRAPPPRRFSGVPAGAGDDEHGILLARRCTARLACAGAELLMTVRFHLSPF